MPAQALAGGPDGQCAQRGDRIELVLTADEFKIPAYDARRGLVLVRPQAELLPSVDRPYAVRLRMPEATILMPLGPTGLFLGLHDGPEELEMVVVAEPGGPDCDAEARPACDELDVRAVHLKRGDLIISSRQLDQPLEPPVSLRTRVLEQVQLDRGDMDAAAVNRLGSRGRALGEACLRKALSHTRAIQGALTVELATSVLGRPDRSRIVVDGLVNPSVSRCLLDRFESDSGLWSEMGPAARAYIVLYFRGESVVESAEPAPPSLLPSSETASGDGFEVAAP